jgi:sigma-E factor negative regulatory protein RseC
MPTEQGIVEKTEDALAWVRVERSSACATCSSRSKCKVDLGEEVVIKAENTVGCRPGDMVRLSMPSGSFFKSTLLVYIAPVFVLLAGAYVGMRLVRIPEVSADAAAAFCGFGAMAVYFFLLRGADKRAARDPSSAPRITGIIKQSAEN